jgi:uncharacterized membrane protein
MVAWGGWAVSAKLATQSLQPETAMILSYTVGAGVALGYVLLRGIPVDPVQWESAFAILAGICSGLGAIALYAGLERGDAAIVTTISALYFVVAAVLGMAVFGDVVGPRDVAGIGLAVVAIILLAT